MVRRVALLGVCVLVMSIGQADLATAQEPITGVCAFPIVHEFPKVHGLHGHELPPAAPYGGFDTGQVIVRVTNVVNGASVTVSSNGPIFGSDDGTELGRGQIVWFLDHDTVGLPHGAWLVTGVSRVVRDASGEIVVVEGGRIRRDICAELA